MRYFAYFLLIFALVVVAGVAIAGKRGSISRKPPLYVFPDMDRQLKLRPQNANAFFTNGYSSQMPVAGTIARSKGVQTPTGPVYSFEDSPVNTGRLAGRTNYVEVSPLPITAERLARGQQRYNIYCAPCHSQVGDGNGITKRIGAMAVVANLHEKRITEMPDGEIFNILSWGKGNMQGYAPAIPVEDRWAIIAYLRALQLSRVATIDDVPLDLQDKLKK